MLQIPIGGIRSIQHNRQIVCIMKAMQPNLLLLTEPDNQGAMRSFFMTGSPNDMKLTPEDVPGVPPLRSGLEYVVDSRGFSTAELAKFKEKCAFWLDVAPRASL
ncbi:Lipase 5 [Apiospora arundinis]